MLSVLFIDKRQKPLFLNSATGHQPHALRSFCVSAKPLQSTYRCDQLQGKPDFICPGPNKVNKAPSKRDSNPQWRVMSTLLNHQLFEFAVRAFMCASLLPTVRIRSPEHKRGLLSRSPTQLKSTREMSRTGAGSGLSSGILSFRLSCHAHRSISVTRHSFKIHAGVEPAQARLPAGCSPPELMDLEGLLPVSFSNLQA